jgi:hypothetical protein
MHEFDLTHGAIPKGRLFLASNGKLYGTTVQGGNFYFNGAQNVYAGMLFEYDLIINKYTVLHYFDFDNPLKANPDIGVIEPIPGILVGATQDRIYKYDITTGTIAFSNPLLYQNIFRGELLKASNGYIYGTSGGGLCPNTTSSLPYLGNIIKYDMVTNNLSFAHSITCAQLELKGAGPSTQLVEASPGKIYGTCNTGGINVFNDPNNQKGGTLFEFNINTNSFTKKIDFNYPTIGATPFNIVIGDNGKLYGLCEVGGVQNSCSFNDEYGTLYEYHTAVNTFEIKQYFNSCISNDFTVRYPQFLMKTSLGHFIGCDVYGNIFKYVLNTNTITRPSFGYKVDNLIEICRKPSYQEIVVNTFDTCEGSNFTYDIQNTNATSYQWQQNGIDVAGQTTGVLNLTNIATSDAGNYTCLMTNECGTTTTMVLHLTVNCLGTNTVATFGKSIKLYPNPTNSILNIELPTNIDVNITSLKVIDLLGNEVLLSTNGSNKIDVSNLSNGIYIISLQTNYGNWNGKFLKE